jgi:hypothetical protein
MVELHSNFTAKGSKTTVDGLEPTHHAEHETIEITQGITDWFETGFYIFTSIQPEGGWEWVGDHIRPRVAIPASWHWPVGLSLSQEFGYQRRKFSVDTWTWEIRPIIDKKIGRWYLSFNRRSIARFTGRVFIAEWSFPPTPRSAWISHDTSLAVWSTTPPTVRSLALIRWLIRGSNFSRASTWIWGRSGSSTSV